MKQSHTRKIRNLPEIEEGHFFILWIAILSSVMQKTIAIIRIFDDILLQVLFLFEKNVRGELDNSFCNSSIYEILNYSDLEF